MLKKIYLYITYGSIVLFALVALLSIWEIIQDNELIWKALTSLVVIGFTGLVGLVISDRINKNK